MVVYKYCVDYSSASALSALLAISINVPVPDPYYNPNPNHNGYVRYGRCSFCIHWVIIVAQISLETLENLVEYHCK